jgi:hypothetical protein
MTFKIFVTILVGTFIITIPALLNGFPFIFPDSGDYLCFHPLLHRSPYYGLFIFFFHLNRFIWAPVVVQSLIVSHLLWLLTSLIGGAARAEARFLLLVILLTMFSSLPFFTGFIMADIFTPIMFLTMYIIVFHYKALSRWLLVYLLMLDCVATAAHVTNLPLAIGTIALFAVLTLSFRQRQHLRPLALLAPPIILTVAAILLFNGAIFGTWSLSPASQSFFLANLIAHGPARHYLDEACPQAGYKICAYRDQFPESADGLLWTTGIFERLGGFPGMEGEARQIVKQTIETRPGEVAAMIARNFAAGLVTHAPAPEFRREYQVPSFPPLIEKKFGRATRLAYENSAEMHDRLPYALLRQIDAVTVPLSCAALIVIVLGSYRRRDYNPLILTAAVFGFIMADTLLCTALSGVHDRYQARVAWLAMMAVLLCLCGTTRTRPR